MKIRFIQHYATTREVFRKNMELEVESIEAKRLVRAGIAEIIDPDPEDPIKRKARKAA